ncbi:hypothetical protein NQ314_012004 [Rhamnusium bicolor]|uniref:CCHC-type domain-containing protein n=1 Tax=Rhamnusium bicolor TaxID=1586634 RepID=A0AAV8XE58_9CUCU|nr:hypothetical protein NQ314_012004 [Rhamnusium bicolor]
MATEEEKKEEMDPNEDTGNIELGDLRLSWIYKLKRDQIDAELGKFRLDLTGTVEEKKRRLIRFIREGCTSPLPPAVFPSIPPPFSLQPPPVARATAALPYRLAPESPALDPWQVHKWNTHFNGKGDPAAFLERLEEICSYTNIRQEQLLPVLPELLQGPALLWYRNNKSHWDTWAKFTRDFRTFYFPVNYLEDLEADISRRLQKPDEPSTNYLTDLQTLVRRHGDLNPEQELRWLYRNLLPDYRQYIRRNDFTDVSSLSAKIKEFELLREEAESRPVVERPVPMPRNTRLPATPREDPSNSVRQQDRPTAPQTAPRTYRSPEPSDHRQSTTAVTYDRNICWRCGRTGHFRKDRTNRLEKLKETFQLVRVNLARAFTSQGHYYNLRRREWRCRVGDRVMKRDNPLSSAVRNFAAKLAPKYSGPYTVTKVWFPVVYDLKSDTGRKYARIHIKDLKPFVCSSV